MKVVTWKCDGCGVKLSEDDESSGRCFELRTPFRTVETDICSTCWEKMCKAIGKTWDRERGLVAREPKA